MTESLTEEIEDSRILQISREKILIISMLQRPGSTIFMVDLEYTYYSPKTDKNNLLDMYFKKWQDLPWIILGIPSKDKNIADQVASTYHLKLTKNIPCMITSEHSSGIYYPIQGDNVFYLESNNGFMDETKERALVDKIFATEHAK